MPDAEAAGGTQHTYVVRVWRSSKDPKSPWRSSALHVASGERRGFSSIDALCDYLASFSEQQDRGPQRRSP